jgi:hypothetical protein
MMDRASAFYALPSEIISMFLSYTDDVVDLQNFTLASSHIWRHMADNRQILPILDTILKNGTTHPQVAFSIYASQHIRLGSSLLEEYVGRWGLDFIRPTFAAPSSFGLKGPGPILVSLPQEMTPLQVRSLLTTFSAIHATAMQCIALYAARFRSLQPLTATEPSSHFDLYADAFSDLPDGPRYSVTNPGSRSTWLEQQRALKGFWMIHLTRVFFKRFREGAFVGWPADRVARVSAMEKSVEILAFKRHGSAEWHWRKRPRDYLLDTLHLYRSAEEYLEEVKAAPRIHWSYQTSLSRQTQRVKGDDNPWPNQVWPTVSEGMEHFVRLFPEIRSEQNGDGYYPWRRLGFAIWDEERLKGAGLSNDADRDRDMDRMRWLSVIREEDFALVQGHRLTVHESDREHTPDYEYPVDTDESWSP